MKKKLLSIILSTILILNFSDFAVKAEENVIVNNTNTHTCEYSYIDNSDGTHSAICECGIVSNEAHEFIDGICKCGAKNIEYNDNGNINNVGDNVNNNVNNGNNDECTHSFVYTDNKDNTHNKKCEKCDFIKNESHSYENNICIYCNNGKENENIEDNSNIVFEDYKNYTYIDNKDGTHNKTNKETNETIKENHTYFYGTCLCGAVDQEYDFKNEITITDGETEIDRKKKLLEEGKLLFDDEGNLIQSINDDGSYEILEYSKFYIDENGNVILFENNNLEEKDFDLDKEEVYNYEATTSNNSLPNARMKRTLPRNYFSGISTFSLPPSTTVTRSATLNTNCQDLVTSHGVLKYGNVYFNSSDLNYLANLLNNLNIKAK